MISMPIWMSPSHASEYWEQATKERETVWICSPFVSWGFLPDDKLHVVGRAGDKDEFIDQIVERREADFGGRT